MRTRRAARAVAGRDCGLSALPDHLLELCMPRTSYTTWHLGNLRLMCKRWKRIFDGSTRLTGGRLRVWGNHIRKRITADDELPPIDLDPAALCRLAACQAAVLQHAEFWEAHKPGQLEAMQQLTSLTSLDLCADVEKSYFEERPDEALAQRQLGLGALPQLRRLWLRAANLLPPTCVQLAAASRLTSLTVETFLEEVPDELWDSLACLPSLAYLEIAVHLWPGNPVVLDSRVWQRLAACTQLDRLRLAKGFVDSLEGEFELQPGITQLTPLRELEVHGNVASLGDLWQHTGLTRLALVECDRPILGPTHSGPSLPALLEASLGTDMREMVPPEHGFFQALSNVTYLCLSSGSEWPNRYDDDIFEQLEGLSQLERLHTLELNARLRSIPDTMRGLTSLKLLDVSDCELRELPEGPYLLGLRTLLMPGHRMRRLPPALATAGSLELLDAAQCGYRPKPSKPLPELQPDDLTLLAAMPALRLLCVPYLYEPPIGRNAAVLEDPALQRAYLEQHMLAQAFCALLPRLVVVPLDMQRMPGLLRGGEYEGGLDAEMLGKVRNVVRSCWTDITQALPQPVREAFQRAADAGELSPLTVALLPPPPLADSPAVAAEPAA